MKKLFNIRVSKENRAGLYLTISFHLIVLIIFLVYQINSVVKQETSFVLDFTKQEELERIQAEQEFKESVSEELDALIAKASAGNTPRNVAVDAGAALKDDRSTNPSEVYDDARRLQEKLDASRREAEAATEDPENIALSTSEEKKTEETYRGPSVLSYRLEGRKGQSLPIPAYKCIGAGDVSVAIVVNRKGYVVAAKVIEAASSTDICLRDYAEKAARRSRFTASSTAPERQAGEIVYRFVAQ